MSTSLRNDSCLLKLCSLSCTLVRSTQPKIPLPVQFFWACKTPTQKFGNFSRVYAPAHRFTSGCFKYGRNRWKMSVRKAALYWWQKKHVLAPTHGAISPNQKIMQVNTVVPHLYSRVHVNPFRFGGVISEKPSHDPQSGCNTGSSGLYYIISIISLSSTNAMILQQTANN